MPLTHSAAIDQALAGFAAGAVSTAVLHPLDLVKTRFQVDAAGTYASAGGAAQTEAVRASALVRTRVALGGTLRAVRAIARTEGGVVRGLWQGLTPNLAAATLSWGLYFFWYAQLKDLIRAMRAGLEAEVELDLATAQGNQQGAAPRTLPTTTRNHASAQAFEYKSGGDGGEALSPKAQESTSPVKPPPLSAPEHLVAAAAGGALTVFFTNPFWVVKTRVCAQKRTDPNAYRGLYDALRRIFKEEGLRGWYKGLVPALFGVSHGAIQFMVYEEMKKMRVRRLERESGDSAASVPPPDTLEYITMAASSKVAAAACTYPYQVVRSRLQNQRTPAPGRALEYKGVVDTIRKIYARERIQGFYKGLAPNLIRVLPGTCITFGVYEGLSEYFRRFGE